MRHTKIIATVGPASDSDAMLDALIAAGTDIFRLNFSHGTHESHRGTFDRIRAAAARAGGEVAILQDLGGPEDPHRSRCKAASRCRSKPGDALRIATGDFVGGPGRRVDDVRRAGAEASGRATGCCSPTASSSCASTTSDGTEIQTTVVDGGDARRAQGDQCARRAAAGLGDHAEGRRRSEVRPVARRRHGRAQLRAERRRPAAGAAGSGRRRRAATCRSSPSSSGRRRSSISTRFSPPATP